MTKSEKYFQSWENYFQGCDSQLANSIPVKDTEYTYFKFYKSLLTGNKKTGEKIKKMYKKYIVK